jgi:hypothetical protein
MPDTTIKAGLEGLPVLRDFHARGLTGRSFWRLSPAPAMTVSQMLPTELARLMAAFEQNRRQYMPYCEECGAEVTYEQSVLRTWVHVDEAQADHVAVQTSHPHSYTPPSDGLRYLVSYKGVALVWVLNDGTLVVSNLKSEQHRKRQEQVVAAFGDGIEDKYL